MRTSNKRIVVLLLAAASIFLLSRNCWAQFPGMMGPMPGANGPGGTTVGPPVNTTSNNLPSGLNALTSLPSFGSFGQDKADVSSKIADAQNDEKSKDPVVRIEGLNEVATIQDPQVDDLLLKALTDPDLRVQVRATDIVGKRRMTDAVPLMSQCLFMRSTPEEEKVHLVSALGNIGDPRGTLSVMHFLEKARDERARGTAVYALGEIGDRRARELLMRVASEDPSSQVRRLAQEALAKIDGELPRDHAPVAKNAQPLMTTDQKLAKFREMENKMRQEHLQPF